MRIAIAMDDFYPASGGIGRSVQTQVEELVRMGHEVTIIVPDHHLEPPHGATTITVPTFYPPGSPSHMCSLRFGPRIVRRIGEHKQFDVVHSQTERGSLMLAAMIARAQGIPHVHTFHANLAGAHANLPVQAWWGTMAYQFLMRPLLSTVCGWRPRYRNRRPSKQELPEGLWARWDWHAIARMAAYVDALTTPSSFMLANIQTAAQGRAHGFVVPTGASRRLTDALSALRRQRTTPGTRFISIGRLSKEKRIGDLTRAFLKAAIPGSELVVVGNGPEARTVEALAGGRSDVRLRGYVRGLDELAQELLDADVLVLASHRFDSQAIVLAEGVVAGLPLLYCDDRLTFGPTPDNSVRTEPDVESLVAGMRAIAEPTLHARLAAGSRAIHDQMSAAATAEGYLAVYRRVIADRATAAVAT